MIIQKVIKGIGGIKREQAEDILYHTGILCNRLLQAPDLPITEAHQRLTERNLFWHQNRYDRPDPLENDKPYYLSTPFISTTAGTVERDTVSKTNVLTPAWLEALRFATDFWQSDGYLFYCYVFVLEKKGVEHESFAEELRELSVYTSYSPFQPEGEITAKIVIPPIRIEKAEFWAIDKIRDDLKNRKIPQPTLVLPNPSFLPPEELSNVREVLK